MSAKIELPVERVHQELLAHRADRRAHLAAELGLLGKVQHGVDRAASPLEVAQPHVVHRRALGQVLLDAEDVAGQELLRGDEHASVELVIADHHVVDPVVVEVRGEIGQRRLRRDDRDVRALAQLADEALERRFATARRMEDVAVRDHVSRDRRRRADSIHLGPGALECGDDGPELVEVAGDGEDAPFRQSSPKLRRTSPKSVDHSGSCRPPGGRTGRYQY